MLGNPAGSADLRSRVGYVTQSATIYDDLRVVDNVRYFAALYGSDANAAEDAIAAVGLTDHRTALCGNLSGGQRTRASLACALVSHPDLLVLDEPTVGLDPVLRVELWDQFDGLARRGTTLIVSSHVMDEADHCGDLLSCETATCSPTPHQSKLREETGCPVTGGSVPVHHSAQHRGLKNRSRLTRRPTSPPPDGSSGNSRATTAASR